MTPSRHVETIDEFTTEELLDFFKSLNKFASFWGINEYQLSYNTGNWKNHDHFHCKIRISEKIISRMRRDHFQLIKLSSSYKNDELGSESE
jgi:diadenosine tetraphosphate (Ap4A) HIT family hydrolase